MGWQPRWRHVSQLFRHSGDAATVAEGANDCFESCLARYLRETGYPFAGEDTALVAAMRLLATGQSDHAGQGFTTLEQGGRALDALGIPWRWTSDLTTARAAPCAILWVRPARLRRATPTTVDGRGVYTDYPLWWLGARDDPDHFILQLPNGAFNDPLSYWNGGQDTVYTATSVAAAFGGAYVLDGTPPWSSGAKLPRATVGSEVAWAQPAKLPRATVGSEVAWAQPAAGQASGVAREPALVVSCPEGLHLREAPALGAPVLATLSDGEALRDAYTDECLWTFVRARGLHGWVRREYVRTK